MKSLQHLLLRSVGGDAQKGNVTLIGFLLVGAITSIGVVSNQNNANRRTEQSLQQQRQHTADQRSLSVLAVVSQLNKRDQSHISGLRLDNYIPPTGGCRQPRNFVGNGASNLWSINGSNITVQLPVTDQLSAGTFDQIFNQRTFNTASLQRNSSQVRILGTLCDDDNDYLIRGIYVEARTPVVNLDIDNNQQQQTDRITTALIPIDPPPASNCELIVRDQNGASINENAEVITDTMTIVYRCNHVIVDAEIRDGGQLLRNTPNSPRTNANQINPNLTDVVSVSLDTDDKEYNLIAVAHDVGGQRIQRNRRFRVRHNNTMTYEEIRHLCGVVHNRCNLLPEHVYPPNVGGGMFHKDYYQGHAPDLFVCYSNEAYWGFDPKDNCRMLPNPVNMRGAEGCFVEGTLVRMKDGSDRAIETLRPGDQVWNPLTRQAHTIQKMQRGLESQDLYEIVTGVGKVTVTDTHPFVTKRGLLQAKYLQAGDLILQGGQETQEITAIQRIYVDPEQIEQLPVVWNLELEGDARLEDHVILANGVPSGDQFLQTQARSASELADLKALESWLNQADDQSGGPLISRAD